MVNKKRFNSLVTGVVSGLILPVIVFLIVWQFSQGHMNLHDYLRRIFIGDLLTHFISISVFPNVFLFLLFNRLDMLESSKGVLGITIVWALATFILKFAF